MMFQHAKESNNLESSSLLIRAFQWRKPILLVSGLATLAAYVFSGPAFITPKFRSTVVFFPPATNSISRALLDDNENGRQDVLAFGAEEEAEQMLQILNSDGIRDAMVRKYDLLTHYRIDKNEEFPQTRLYEEYRDNISFARTEFMSVRIDVLDTDPQMAADMANDIAFLMDSTRDAIRRTRALEALDIVEKAYQDKEHAIDLLEDSLAGIRLKGVIDYSNQSRIWTEEHARSLATLNNERASLAVLQKHHGDDPRDTSIINTKARIEGASARVSIMEKKLGLLASYGGAALSLSERLELERKELSRLQDRLDRARVDATEKLSNKFIVNKAVKAERKSTPVRWLIVLLTGAGSLLLSFLGLLLAERLRYLALD
jgi:uncharacterized protein involved in exopolysaccharide biosynthesis